MVTYKLALDERRAKQNGTFPLVVRVTYNRKVIAFQTGVYLLPEHWSKTTLQVSKTNLNWLALSHKASEFYVKVQKAILTIENGNDFSFETLKDIITPKPIAPVKLITFKSFSQSVIDDMIKVKRTGGALVYLTAVNRLIDYCCNPNISFNEIDYTFLDGFKNKLLEQGLKKNSVGNYFRSVRALYNKAIKAKVVARDLYPFNDISIQTEKTAKRAIGIKELSQIYQYPKRPYSQPWHAANFFFLSFALRGMSFTDMAYLTNANIYKGCITYRRRKTKKLYTIKLHPIALQILSYYKDNGSGYLIPVFPNGTIEDSEDAHKITRQWIKITNKYLNQIASCCGLLINLTTYVTRHTWATISKKLGYSNEMIAEALGHEYGNKITNIYLDDFDQSLIDSMNDIVIINVIPCLKMVTHPCRFTLRPSSHLNKYKSHKTNLSIYPIHNFKPA